MLIIFKHYKLLNVDEHIKLLSIRNDKNIRQHFIDTAKIELNNHLKWVENLKDEYFCVFLNKEIVGGVNFKDNEWGIFFKNIPFIPLVVTKSYIDYLFTKQKTLYSRVKKTNKKAIIFNKNLGVEFYKEDDKYLYMKLTLDKWLSQKNTSILKILEKRKTKAIFIDR